MPDGPPPSGPGEAPTSEVKVLYIMGFGRSGSTLIDNAFGELEGFFSAGELRESWLSRLRGTYWCGCGLKLADCEFWSSVMKTGFGEDPEAWPDPEDVRARQEELLKIRNIPRFVRNGADGNAESPALRELADVTTRLYHSISEVSGATVIVDSSKRVAGAALLPRLKGISPYFVHLVRDPRAVAFSWQRRKRSPEGVLMRRSDPRHIAVHWSKENLAAEALSRWFADRSLLLRYEDFIAAPQAAFAAVRGLLGLPAGSEPLLRDGGIVMSGNHSAAGNPSRFASGFVELKSDDAWLSGLPAHHVRSVTERTLPLLLRYGYPLRRSRWPGPRRRTPALYGRALLGRKHQRDR